MIKIGLTGSIGMGKSTVAKMFADLGAAVWDADDAVHRMYGKDGAAIEPIRALFPAAVLDGVIDRQRLAAIVLSDPAALQKLEAVVHPLVASDREEFIAAAAHAGVEAAVFDIPLLFENGSEQFFDVVIVVSAPAAVQEARVLERPGMTRQKLDAILSEQLPDAQKRERADYIVSTDRPLAETRSAVEAIFKEIIRRRSD